MPISVLGTLLIALSACGTDVPTSTPVPFLLPSPRAGAAACPTVESERTFVARLAGKGIVVTAVTASVGEALFPSAPSVCLMDVGSASFEAAFFADAQSAHGVRVCEGRSGDRHLYRVDGHTVDAAFTIYWTIAGNVVVWTGDIGLDRSMIDALGGSRPRC